MLSTSNSFRRLVFQRIFNIRYRIDNANLKKNAVTNATTNLKYNVRVQEKGTLKSTTDKKRLSANVVEPTMELERRKEIQSVVGIHLGTNSLYWAKIARDGVVQDWKYVNLFPSVDIGRKMSLPKIFAMMDCALENIPFSDIFVLEASNHSMLTSVSSPAVISSAILRSQISAVLLTILNLRLENEQSEEYYHKVFLLKQRIVSRFFNLLVGTERVSALGLVDLILADSDSLPSLSISEIMDGSKAVRESTPSTDISAKNSLPIYTPIQVPTSIIESYRALGAVEREAMSQALLITMAFYDLVVFKDPKILATFQK